MTARSMRGRLVGDGRCKRSIAELVHQPRHAIGGFENRLPGIVSEQFIRRDRWSRDLGANELRRFFAAERRQITAGR